MLHDKKLSGCRIRIKFHKYTLAVEQNNCTTEIVNDYIVYYLATWLINPSNNFKFRNCLFGATNIVKK